jgi:hypothetical protein
MLGVGRSSRRRLDPVALVAGQRKTRITATLATGIPEDITRSINLDYLDPAEVDLMAPWAADGDTHVVPDAGKDLYRFR